MTLNKKNSNGIRRRKMLQVAAGAAMAPALLAAANAQPSPSPTKAPRPPGKPGDFAFLTGEWRISHRRLKDAAKDEWDTFTGEATCWGILGGIGSIEELRIPARNFSGMGVRLLDVENRVWNDFWVNAKFGVLSTPGLTGSFENGVGTFIAEDVIDGKPIISRGVWDRITKTSCRWHQASSKDGGKTWQPDWFMDWVRA
jgi:hypothetical protein